MKKDKAKVLDEQWDDARVASFLEPRPGDGATSGDIGVDYALLLRAYQSMRASDFGRFVPLFCADGRNVNAQGPDGKSLLQLLREHNYGGPYADILRKSGAV